MLILGLLVGCQPRPSSILPQDATAPFYQNTVIVSATATDILDSPTPSSIGATVSLSPTRSASTTHTLTPDSAFDVLTATPTVTLEAAFQMCSPLAEESIAGLWEIVSDAYNPPPPGRDERHQGVDFAHYRRRDRLSIQGEIVQAILPAKVIAVIKDRLPYGNMVILETPYEMIPPDLITPLGMTATESLYHLYAHFEALPLVERGDSVTCGQALGAVGKTGYNIVNPHLHFETRFGPAGATFENMVYYDPSATEDEMENYRRWRTSGEFRHFDPLSLFSAYLAYIGQIIP